MAGKCKQGPNLITGVDDEPNTNIFCFGAFTNKTTGVVYNNCKGEFLFMSLNNNVCTFVMYHYEMNAIFATLIPSLDSKSILEVYT